MKICTKIAAIFFLIIAATESFAQGTPGVGPAAVAPGAGYGVNPNASVGGTPAQNPNVVNNPPVVNKKLAPTSSTNAAPQPAVPDSTGQQNNPTTPSTTPPTIPTRNPAQPSDPAKKSFFNWRH
jgi:hypothetical protein